MTGHMLRIVATAKPVVPTPRKPRTPVSRVHIKHATERAQIICGHDATTYECRAAWEDVEELCAEADRQRSEELKTRLYDL